MVHNFPPMASPHSQSSGTSNMSRQVPHIHKAMVWLNELCRQSKISSKKHCKMVKTHIWRSSILAHLLQWMVVLHQLSSSCNGTQKPYYHLQSHTASKPPNYSSAYYNQGAKSLPSLSAHDTVRIQNGTSWATKGKVIEPLEYPPRSYTVETESGHRLRRNRRDLLSTKEEFTPSPNIGITQPSTNTSVEQDQHSTDPHSTYGEESRPTPTPIYTRSRRQVIRPIRFKDSV